MGNTITILVMAVKILLIISIGNADYT